MKRDGSRAVSLKVSEDLRKRIAEVAKQQGVTPHHFMLEAICEKLDAEEARLAFHAEAERRLVHIKETDSGIPALQVFEYLQRRADGRKVTRPKPRKAR